MCNFIKQGEYVALVEYVALAGQATCAILYLLMECKLLEEALAKTFILATPRERERDDREADGEKGRERVWRGGRRRPPPRVRRRSLFSLLSYLLPNPKTELAESEFETRAVILSSSPCGLPYVVVLRRVSH